MIISEELYEDFTDAENDGIPHRKSSFNSGPKLLETHKSVAVLKILGTVEFGNYEEVRALALDRHFISENPGFVRSGELIRKAMDRNLVEFIVQLEKAGYTVPDDLLIKSIKQQKTSVINTIISCKFYNSLTVELEFWYLLYKGYTQYIDRLSFNEPRNFDYHNEKLCTIAIKRALQRNLDSLASKILAICPESIDLEMIEIAIDTDSLEFIRRVWTGDISDLQKSRIKKKRNTKTVLWKYLNLDQNQGRKQLAKKYLDISYIIQRLLQKKLINEAKKVILWPEAVDDDKILNICIEMNEEELARDVMKHRKKEIKKSDFEFAFKEKKFWLCLDMLRFKEPKALLLSQEIQSKVVELLADGETCYFASEFLNSIDLKFWTFSLIPSINEILSNSIKKTESLVKCPFPLLYLVLMCEFLQKVGKKSLHFYKTCTLLVENLLKLAKFIQDGIDEELELRIFLYAADTQNRTVLTIIAENGFYSLLENEDLGSVVDNMWAGERKTISFMNASTLYKAFKAPAGSMEKLLFLNGLAGEDCFSFQFEQLVSSCKLRFMGQMLSTLLLVYFYTMMIYTATVANSIGDVPGNTNSDGFLRISQVWIFGMFAEKLVQIVFCLMAKRKVTKDFWLFNDFLISFLTVIIMTGLNKDYTLTFVGSTDLNTIMYGLVLCLIWLRFFNVLLTTSYGPMIMIIYNMYENMVRFLVVFFGAIFISSVLMSTLFHSYTADGEFDNFSNALVQIVSLSMNNFDLTIYTDYIVFGGICEGLLVIILTILLLNILIAILGSTYDKESERETCKFRAILIKCYNKWKWDDRYGVLILLPPPLSILSVLILPFVVISKNPGKITDLFARFIFLFYAIPFFLVFSIFSFVFAVAIYLTSLSSFATGGVKKVQNKEILFIRLDEEDSDGEDEQQTVHIRAFSHRRAIVWVLIGWIIALVAYFRDVLNFWAIVFKKTKEKLTAQEKLICPEFIENTLKALKKTPKFYFSLEEFLEVFYEIDLNELNPIFRSDENKVGERKKLISRFFKMFLYSRKMKTVRKEFLTAFIKKSSHYGENYLQRVRGVRVNLLIKALKKYRKYCREIVINGVKIPRILINGETFQVKEVLMSAKGLMQQQIKVGEFFKGLDKRRI